jgi:predicted transcriptional regulator
MLENLITSKTRIKLLLKFFLNSKTTTYLRNLESEFGESTNAIRLELNRFEKAGLLSSKINGNKKYYKANTKHPLFPDIHNILLKYTGIDSIIDEVIVRMGNLSKAYITGDFAIGKNSKLIDLIIVGKNLNYEYLGKLIRKAEEITSLKIKYITINPDEENEYVSNKEDVLLIWSADK